MRLLMGLIHPGQAGGIYVTEKPFVDECMRRSDIEIITFLFGSRSQSEKGVRRVLRSLIDVTRYAVLLRRHKPDIVHINSAFDKRALLRDVWYVILSRAFRVPIFIKFHGSEAHLLLSDSIIWRWLTRRTLNGASGIGVLSQEERHNFVAAGYKPEMFTVLTNVVNWERFAGRTAEEMNPPRILFIARFVSTKGLLEVIRALRIVLDSGRRLELKCIGDGPEMKNAVMLVEVLGLTRHVTFEGWIPEEGTTAFYLNATMLVLPTETEGFSMAIFQALAAGLPIITTKIRAAGEYLKEPDNCLWIEPKNVAMLAEKITRLLDHPELREQMSRNNKSLAREFPAERVVEAYLRVYESILEKNGHGKQPRGVGSSMTVLFNTPDLHLHGGPATHLYLLEGELAKRLRVQQYLYGRRTDTETLFNKFFDRLGDLFRLIWLVRDVAPDIIHHNSAFDGKSIFRDAPLVILARWYKIPILIKIHGSHRESFGRLNPLLMLFRRYLLNGVDCLGVLSSREEEEFVERWPELRDRIAVVKNIVKTDFFQVVRQESSVPSILFISRFIRKKGMFDLLEAVPKVLRSYPNAQFTFIGGGGDEEEFCKLVADSRLGENVRWESHISNVDTARYYASTWLFVFPTEFPEGMPMVVAEAMAAGVPIVTTRTRFSLSYMREREHCLFVDHQSPAGIARAVLELLGSPALREAISANNRQLARQFTAESVTNEFSELYAKILGRVRMARLEGHVLKDLPTKRNGLHSSASADVGTSPR